MLFSDVIANPTVRFGAGIYPTVRFGTVFKILEKATARFGAVFEKRIYYSAVRLFHVLHGARFGAVLRNKESSSAVLPGFLNSKSLGAVRFYEKYDGAVRCGSPLDGLFYGAVEISVVGKQYKIVFTLR